MWLVSVSRNWSFLSWVECVLYSTSWFVLFFLLQGGEGGWNDIHCYISRAHSGCTVRIHVQFLLRTVLVHTAGWVGLGVTEREENLFEMPLTDKQWYSRPTRRLYGSVAHCTPTYRYGTERKCCPFLPLLVVVGGYFLPACTSKREKSRRHSLAYTHDAASAFLAVNAWRLCLEEEEEERTRVSHEGFAYLSFSSVPLCTWVHTGYIHHPRLTIKTNERMWLVLQQKKWKTGPSWPPSGPFWAWVLSRGLRESPAIPFFTSARNYSVYSELMCLLQWISTSQSQSWQPILV